MENKYIKEVIEEIHAIKTHATDEEKSKLDFHTFSPYNSQNCIYGQMTGECRSERAVKLIELCCKRLYSINESEINGTDINLLVEDAKSNGYEYKSFGEKWMSLLEHFIQHYSDNYRILNFIKGKTNELNLN